MKCQEIKCLCKSIPLPINPLQTAISQTRRLQGPTHYQRDGEMVRSVLNCTKTQSTEKSNVTMHRSYRSSRNIFEVVVCELPSCADLHAYSGKYQLRQKYLEYSSYPFINPASQNPIPFYLILRILTHFQAR